jgi:hypothetical protein
MRKIVLFHDEMLNPAHALVAAYPDLPRVYVFDTPQIARDQFSLRRIQFIADCVAEIPDIQVYRGATGEVLQMLGVREVVTQRTPQLYLGTALANVVVEWHDEPQFVEFRGRLKRFMHYWKAVEPQLLGGNDELDPPEPQRRPRGPKDRRDQMRIIARDGASPLLASKNETATATAESSNDGQAMPAGLATPPDSPAADPALPQSGLL